MLRLYICIGDQPETGGQIEPYVGPRTTFYGHQAAMIGAGVYCNACKSTGVIAKAGGPRRRKHHGSEIVLDGDILLCGCAQPPRMIASMQRNARFDDLAETMGVVASARTVSGGVTSMVTSAYDEQVEPSRGTLIEGYPYFIETQDGRVFSGRLESGHRLQRVYTATPDNYTIFWGDDALARQEGV
ncbi:PAAR domain-containing protein [Paraburkholderia sediminicola]|uniref:PAAR domain-containing protein n=1 Tax=Paraburkholderia sediminicola TaxID=458836 RepID=UPI0038BCB324